MNVQVAGTTHVGMKRAHNEDSLFLMPEHCVYVVADGMGGHASGEVASKMAVETVADFFVDTAEDDEVTWPYRMDKERHYEENRLINAIKLANLRIFEASSADPRKKGMGTTLVSIYGVNGGVYLGHVGDSRIYHVRPTGEIDQLTEDHSLLNDYIKMKNLTPEEIEHFPHKNVIVRALGMKETVTVDTAYVEPAEGDLLVLCSDGLSGMITDEMISELTRDRRTQDQLQAACDELIAAANDAGGTDNITVIVARFGDDGSSDDDAEGPATVEVSSAAPQGADTGASEGVLDEDAPTARQATVPKDENPN